MDVGREIPPNLYRAVAEVLAYIYKLTNPRRRSRSRGGDLPEKVAQALPLDFESFEDALAGKDETGKFEERLIRCVSRRRNRHSQMIHERVGLVDHHAQSEFAFRNALDVNSFDGLVMIFSGPLNGSF